MHTHRSSAFQALRTQARGHTNKYMPSIASNIITSRCVCGARGPLWYRYRLCVGPVEHAWRCGFLSLGYQRRFGMGSSGVNGFRALRCSQRSLVSYPVCDVRCGVWRAVSMNSCWPLLPGIKSMYSCIVLVCYQFNRTDSLQCEALTTTCIFIAGHIGNYTNKSSSSFLAIS